MQKVNAVKDNKYSDLQISFILYSIEHSTKRYHCIFKLLFLLVGSKELISANKENVDWLEGYNLMAGQSKSHESVKI